MEQGKASTRTKNAWNRKTYDQFLTTVKKGEKDVIRQHAEKHGESLNGFVNRAIKETIERDNETAE